MTHEIRSEAIWESEYDDPHVEGEEASLGALLSLIRLQQRLPKAAVLYFGPTGEYENESEGLSVVWGDNEANMKFVTMAHDAIKAAMEIDAK